jgi:hypothetical protein
MCLYVDDEYIRKGRRVRREEKEEKEEKRREKRREVGYSWLHV